MPVELICFQSVMCEVPPSVDLIKTEEVRM